MDLEGASVHIHPPAPDPLEAAGLGALPQSIDHVPGDRGEAGRKSRSAGEKVPLRVVHRHPDKSSADPDLLHDTDQGLLFSALQEALGDLLEALSHHPGAARQIPILPPTLLVHLKRGSQGGHGDHDDHEREDEPSCDPHGCAPPSEPLTSIVRSSGGSVPGDAEGEAVSRAGRPWGGGRARPRHLAQAYRRPIGRRPPSEPDTDSQHGLGVVGDDDLHLAVRTDIAALRPDSKQRLGAEEGPFIVAVGTAADAEVGLGAASADRQRPGENTDARDLKNTNRSVRANRRHSDLLAAGKRSTAQRIRCLPYGRDGRSDQPRTLIWFTTSLTPSVSWATRVASWRSAWEPPSPVRVTVPRSVWTVIWDAFTPRSKARAIFTEAVSVASCTDWPNVFSVSSGASPPPGATRSSSRTSVTPSAFLAISTARSR